MEKMDLLYKKALEIAKTAHEGQTDKGGKAYIEHPMRVAESVDTMELKTIALLHDVLEDTSVKREDLEKAGFTQHIIETVCDLTNDDDSYEGYLEYICRLKSNPMAVSIKMADLRDNMNLSRIPNPTERDYARMEKYKKAYAILESNEE